MGIHICHKGARTLNNLHPRFFFFSFPKTKNENVGLEFPQRADSKIPQFMIKSRYRSLGKSPGQPTTGGKNAECPWRCQCFLRCPALTLLGWLLAARLCRGTCFSSLSLGEKEREGKKKCISKLTFPLSSPLSERRQVSLWFFWRMTAGRQLRRG